MPATNPTPDPKSFRALPLGAKLSVVLLGPVLFPVAFVAAAIRHRNEAAPTGAVPTSNAALVPNAMTIRDFDGAVVEQVRYTEAGGDWSMLRFTLAGHQVRTQFTEEGTFRQQGSCYSMELRVPTEVAKIFANWHARYEPLTGHITSTTGGPNEASELHALEFEPSVGAPDERLVIELRKRS